MFRPLARAEQEIRAVESQAAQAAVDLVLLPDADGRGERILGLMRRLSEKLKPRQILSQR